MTLDAKIEAILFWKGEPTTVKKLSEFLDVDKKEIVDALKVLEEKLADRGIALMRDNETVALGTKKGISDVISELTKEELHRDIGRAGLEVLSIVAYKGNVSRKEIEYIRGVNSSYVIRNLLMRGLIEVSDEKDGRSRFYKPTIDLLSFLGISNIKDLPEYEFVQSEFGKVGTEENQNENV